MVEEDKLITRVIEDMKEAQKAYNKSESLALENMRIFGYKPTVYIPPSKWSVFINWITGLRIVHKDRIEDEMD